MTTARDIRDYDDAALVGCLRGATDQDTRETVISEILRRYEAPLRAYCHRRLAPDWAAGEEAVADTLSSAWQVLRGGKRAPRNLRAWLFEVARRRCLAVGRRIGEHKAHFVPEPEATALQSQSTRTRRLQEAEVQGAARVRQALALVDDIVQGMSPDRQLTHELHLRRRLTGPRLAAKLGRTTVQANSVSQRHRAQLIPEFEVNLLARDPGSRTPCSQLSRPVRGEPQNATPCSRLTGFLADAVRVRPGLRAVLDDPDSTVALPYALCRKLVRHTRDCATCRANIDRVMLRWAPAVAVLLGTGSLVGGGPHDMQQVASVTPAAPPATPPAPGLRHGGGPARSAGRPRPRGRGRGRGRRPAAHRHLIVPALGATALWGVLYLSGLTPGAGADHITLLGPSVTAPREAAPRTRDDHLDRASNDSSGPRPTAERSPAPSSPRAQAGQRPADSAPEPAAGNRTTERPAPPAQAHGQQLPAAPPPPASAPSGPDGPESPDREPPEAAAVSPAQPPAQPGAGDTGKKNDRQPAVPPAQPPLQSSKSLARQGPTATGQQPPAGNQHAPSHSGPHSDAAQRDPGVLTPRAGTPPREPG
ncbi:hypothetical protein [Streptomyces cinnamoneus]|uniref:hypothetical protein n=1 Tax=Streptomyces cinnamoneus TaxID=53446 RepID=UPI0037A5A5C7